MFGAKDREFPRVVSSADHQAAVTTDPVIKATITIQNALQDLKRTERDLVIQFVQDNLEFHDRRKLESDHA
jgi:hypothetical protein